MADDLIRVALAGNPNAGKTTLFNQLTGARQYVANYPGATVQKKSGRRRHRDKMLEFVDLPGTYALTAFTPEELVARSYCLEESPEAIIDVIDASNLERNLYLAVQFLEFGAPLVLALNMADLAAAHGLEIDSERLSLLLGVKIIPTVGTRGTGIEQLLDTVLETADSKTVTNPIRIDYGREIESELALIEAKVSEILSSNPSTSHVAAAKRPALAGAGRGRQATGLADGAIAEDVSADVAGGDADELTGDAAAAGNEAFRSNDNWLFNVPPRWLAVKLLEGDEVVLAELQRLAPAATPAADLERTLDQSRRHLGGIFSHGLETAIADRRYGFISGACREAVRTTSAGRVDLSDKADAIILHRVVGLLIFGAMMFGVFSLVFTIGDPLVGWLEEGIAALGGAVGGLWPEGSDSPLKGLIVDGLIEGVGAVLVFLPNIALLFLALAVLEDSGYLARAAFLMDRVMHYMGLHGKSFIPMLMGFGCSVPGILATRTLDTRRDRLITMFVLPLVSCNARLPIYLMILPIFFPGWLKAPMLWMMYMIGIGLAVLMARIMRGTMFRGEAAPFVIELPPYRMPTLRGVLMHTWERSSGYIKRAGTIILLLVIVLWAASNYPKPTADRQAELQPDEQMIAAGAAAGGEVEGESSNEAASALQASAIGRLASFVEPVMQPMGFDWRITTAIIPAMAAKETFVSQMGIAYSLEVDPEAEEGDEDSTLLARRMARDYTPLVGFCVMLFCLISTPCIGTIAATWRESGQMRWALLQLAVLTATAYLLTTAVYQIGSALQLGTAPVVGQ